jgi:alkanesulfonate monooxygenase SsuD/methylene tetrahydromethanopterin reductase-like flavin-dependent oxidoreductase (luciferase family)
MPTFSEVSAYASQNSHLAGNSCGSALARRLLIEARMRSETHCDATRDHERRRFMELGYFTMPSHPPECGLKEGNDWDLQTLRWLDELGYQEAWVGEHHTAPWEPNPTPDLLIAQALLQTKNIRIGPGGFLLPYHHPAELANRVAMLDHLSDGRLNFGVAASGLPSDWAMFNVDGMSGQNRDMTREALEIILKLWSEPAPFTHKGKYWTVTKPDTMFDFLKPHIKPLQAPHPPIGVAGLSKNSDTLKLAGERGFIPMSLNLNPAYVGSHWDSVEAGAAKTGRKPSRKDWRLVREVFVADTDEEAWKLSTGDMMGRMMGEYFLPLLGHFGFKDYLKHAPDVPDSDVTVEYCARRNWIVGSPATVTEKIEKIYHEVGGFGVLLVFGFDYKHKPEAWRHSLELLQNEVMPRLKHLGADLVKAA